jgi:hypothetical protein
MSGFLKRDPFGALLALAPVVFLLHVAEEAPGFVRWFNAHVGRDITSESFWQVNISALVITIIVSAMAWLDSSAVSAALATAWLAFLMAANALLHAGGAIVDRSYVPGLVTALVLYLPYFALVVLQARKRGVSVVLLTAVSTVSAIPMLVHGYRIIFLGTRLF